MQQKFCLLVLVLVLLHMDDSCLLAQVTGKPLNPSLTKTKKPLVKSWLGKIAGATTMSADDARKIITLPLKIKDDKNIDYLISSYQFAYKRIGVTENEETGKTAPQTDLAADRFTVTPLPPVWQKNIIEGLHPGEELYFFDIIVFDKQGRRFFAPELKITIQ